MKFQGIFVFLFYIVLKEEIRTHWLTKLGLKKTKTTAAVVSTNLAAASGSGGSITGGNLVLTQNSQARAYDVDALDGIAAGTKLVFTFTVGGSGTGTFDIDDDGAGAGVGQKFDWLQNHALLITW